jgi:hypothetical protein
MPALPGSLRYFDWIARISKCVQASGDTSATPSGEATGLAMALQQEETQRMRSSLVGSLGSLR